MKYTIRRILVGIIATPVIAGIYMFGYIALLLLGAEPTASFTDTFNNGLFIGVTASVFLVFYPQISHLLDKVIY